MRKSLDLLFSCYDVCAGSASRSDDDGCFATIPTAPPSATPMLEALRKVTKVVAFLLRALLICFMVSLPLLGVWAASSLAAFSNAPIWVALACGLLLFPLIPVSWEAWSTSRFKKRVKSAPRPEEVPERILILSDRLVLRTLSLNLAFVTALALAAPERSFLALSTRGDWMLESADGRWVEPTRSALFGTAEGLEWLYHWATDNPYRDLKESPHEAPAPAETGRLERWIPDIEGRSAEGADDESEHPRDEKMPPLEPALEEEKEASSKEKRPGAPPKMTWPPPPKLHPLVENMPGHAEKSIASVGEYIKANEDDPMWRVKAIFDYVADRIAYDVEALKGSPPPQDAETVFDTQKGVCAGYANLMRALGEVTGDEIAYVVGIARNLDGDVGGSGHAWNAARIEGRWFLLDATWGAGHIGDGEFVKTYNPDFLFTPPEVLINSHFPDQRKWQLLESPITRGEFLRQPVLRAGFFANGLELIEPKRSQISATSTVRLEFDNPKSRFLIALAQEKSKGRKERCRVQQGERPVVECDLPHPGTYRISFFGNEEQVGTYRSWGRIEVHGTGQ